MKSIAIVLTLLILAIAVVVVGAWLFVDWVAAMPSDTPATYVGSPKCRECHEKEYELWADSDHDLAMDIATEQTVLGDFRDSRFTHVGFDQVAKLDGPSLAALIGAVPNDQWAMALKDSPEPIPGRVLGVLSKSDRQAVEERMQWLEVVRPCDISDARQNIGDAMRHLADEGKLTLPNGVVTSHFFREGDDFFVTTDGPTGEMQTLKVKYVFGHWPLQQYLIEFPGGKIQCLGVAWDSVKNKWYHLYPSEQIPAHDILHWTKPLQNWNYMCAECHTTNLDKDFRVGDQSYHTKWSEIHVGCETCHGPGSIHVKLSESGGVFWDRRLGYGLVNLKDRDSRTEIESCAPCHSHRRVVYPYRHDNRPLPTTAGHKFLDYYLPAVFDGNLYYADGQILEEDYVYGSFIQSKMYEQGVRCSDCHDPHSLRVKFLDPDAPRGVITTNQMCTDCHMGTHPAGKYDAVSHHHHPDATKAGTKCVDCHMPETTYMVADPRRDHSMRVPRPDLTISLGIPNACNGCHNDPEKGETAEWAQEWIEKWYPKDQKQPTHFAYAIDAGRRQSPEGQRLLTDLLQRSDLNASIRATALLLLARYRTTVVPAALVEGLEHEDELVRTAAVQSIPRVLSNITGGLTLESYHRRLHDLVAPRLFDPIRSVRLEAARILTELPKKLLSADEQEALAKAIVDFATAQEYLGDQAAAHVNMAIIHQNQARHQSDSVEQMAERFHRAKHAYERALTIDPVSIPARNNLAMLLDEMSRLAPTEPLVSEESQAKYFQQATELQAAAAEQFREILKIDPDLPDAHYSLGLLLAAPPPGTRETPRERLEEATRHLGEAARLAPERVRVRYNYGLALEKLGRLDDAEVQLLAIAPYAQIAMDARTALVPLYLKQGKFDQAEKAARELCELDPSNPDWRALLQQIQLRRVGAGSQSGP